MHLFFYIKKKIKCQYPHDRTWLRLFDFPTKCQLLSVFFFFFGFQQQIGFIYLKYDSPTPWLATSKLYLRSNAGAPRNHLSPPPPPNNFKHSTKHTHTNTYLQSGAKNQPKTTTTTRYIRRMRWKSIHSSCFIDWSTLCASQR